MKYTNWQDIHKKVYSTKPKQIDPKFYSFEDPNASYIETVHHWAWHNLEKHCSEQELTNLMFLAFLYDSGRRKAGAN